MHRFHLPPAACRESTLLLTGGEAHHALRVLRLRRGETVTVLDGAGREYRCEVVEPAGKSLRLVVKASVEVPPPPCQVTLVQAIPKGKILESILQKATELGAHRVVPLLSERVVTRLNDERAEHKTEHWRQIAIEAIKQCGAAWLPSVEPPENVTQAAARMSGFDLPLLASLQPGSRHPREWFEGFQREHQRRPRSVCVCVGPEGDFTDGEVEALLAAGARPISLGPRVLRVETAAVYCLSLVNYEMTAPPPASP